GLGGTFLEQVLWTLYRDPACTSPFILNRRIAPWETAGPGHLDIEVTFCKQSASIVSTVEVNDRDNGHIVHTRETHYSLRGGAWNAEVVRNWNRQA
ncbi:MAG: hypothetical protein ACJ72H_15480, partial [Candidatus Sulfotelmatobacter sp.]